MGVDTERNGSAQTVNPANLALDVGVAEARPSAGTRPVTLAPPRGPKQP